MRKFKTRDKVKIKSDCYEYSFTGPGSEGIFIRYKENSSDEVLVEWFSLIDKITGQMEKTQIIYSVYETHLELIKRKNEAYGISKFLDKINKR